MHNSSIHAAAVVISDRDLTDILPLQIGLSFRNFRD